MNANDLKARIDLRTIAEQVLGTPVRRSYQYLQFRAPDREDRTPSLTVWADGFKDFGADQHGDVFDFLSHYGRQSFQEAVAYLGGAIDGLPLTIPHPQSQRRHADTPDPTWQHAAEHALRQCQAALELTPAARDYLHQQGYSDTTIDLRGLGFNPEWKRLEWTKADGRPAWLPPGIVFPWYHDGQLYALKVRTAHGTTDQPDAVAQLLRRPPEPAKYMQVAGGHISQAWYGHIDRPQHPVILCEGEKDCDNLYQALGDSVNVITLGSATGRLPDSLLGQLAHAAWIAIVLDNDTAGQRNALRLQTQLTQHLSLPVILGHVPAPYKDITDWVLGGGDTRGWFSQLQHDITPQLWNSPTATYFVQGVPDALREAILGLHQLGRPYIKDQANAALVLELWHEAILQGRLDPYQPFSVGQLAAAQQRGSGTSSLRRGLEQLVGLGLVDFFADFQPELRTNAFQIEGGESAKKTRRGRPSIGYQFRPIPEALTALLDQLERRLREAAFANQLPDHVRREWFEGWADETEAERWANILESHSDALYNAYAEELKKAEAAIAQEREQWAKRLHYESLASGISTPIAPSLQFSCGREYRDAFYHALIEDAGPMGRQISRAKASAQLGVTSRTLSRIRQRVKVIAEPRYRYFRLHTPHGINHTADRLAPWAAERVHGRYLESSSGACIRLIPQNEARSAGWMASQLAQGHQVWLKVQVASRERFATAEEAELMEVGQVPSGQGRANAEPPCIAEVCPRGATAGYVRDQLRLRLGCIWRVVQGDSTLREVLRVLRVLE